MSRNGAGTYSLPEAAFVYDSVISETAVNSNFTDIASALTASLAANGETTVTANLPMNSKKFTGLAAGTALTDSATLGQVQNEAYIWCGTMTGTADAGTLTPSPAITAYAAGQRFAWKASANVNTGAMTIAISGLTTIAVQNDRAALAAGDHAADDIYMGVLDTTSTIQIMKFANDATSGDVVGPGSATDDNIAVYDGTTGKLLKDGGATLAAYGKLADDSTWTGAQRPTVTALTSSAASIAIELNDSNDFSHTFTEDTTLANPTSVAVAGQSGSIYLTQHASAPKTLAFGSEYDFAGGTAPTVTATNSARDRLDYVVRADGQIEITALLNLS